MKENEEITKPNTRVSIREALAEGNPEWAGETDDELFDGIYGAYQGQRSTINELRGNEDAIRSALDSDPRNSALLEAIIDGKAAYIPMFELFYDELVEALNDPSSVEGLEDAIESYTKRQKTNKEATQLAGENLTKSIEAFKRVKDEFGLNDEEAETVVTRIADVINAAIVHDIPEDVWRILIKGFKYDEDVADAAIEGEIKGRNEKIDAKKKEVKPQPMISSGATTPNRPKRRTIGGFLDNQKKSTWDD